MTPKGREHPVQQSENTPESMIGFSRHGAEPERAAEAARARSDTTQPADIKSEGVTHPQSDKRQHREALFEDIFHFKRVALAQLRPPVVNLQVQWPPQSFLFVVNGLMLNEDYNDGGVMPRMDEEGRWLPPIYQAGFGRQNRGTIYRWNGGKVSTATGYMWEIGRAHV